MRSPVELLGIGNFVDDKYCKGSIDCAFKFLGEADRVRGATMRPYTGHETFRLHLLPQDTEHLLLQVNGDYHAIVARPPGKLAGEKSRPATEIKDTAPGLDVSFSKAIGPEQKPSQPVLRMPGPGGGEDLVVVRDRAFSRVDSTGRQIDHKENVRQYFIFKKQKAAHPLLKPRVEKGEFPGFCRSVCNGV